MVEKVGGFSISGKVVEKGERSRVFLWGVEKWKSFPRGRVWKSGKVDLKKEGSE